jgi:ferredoxin
MRVELDEPKCVAAGQCVMAAPEVFDQRDDDGVAILLEEQPGRRTPRRGARGRGDLPGRGDPAGRPVRRIVVVGASAAGLAAVETLRREGYDGTLTLVGDEPHAAVRPAAAVQADPGRRVGARPAGAALVRGELDALTWT